MNTVYIYTYTVKLMVQSQCKIFFSKLCIGIFLVSGKFLWRWRSACWQLVRELRRWHETHGLGGQCGYFGGILEDQRASQIWAMLGIFGRGYYTWVNDLILLLLYIHIKLGYPMINIECTVSAWLSHYIYNVYKDDIDMMMKKIAILVLLFSVMNDK